EHAHAERRVQRGPDEVWGIGVKVLGAEHIEEAPYGLEGRRHGIVLLAHVPALEELGIARIAARGEVTAPHVEPRGIIPREQEKLGMEAPRRLEAEGGIGAAESVQEFEVVTDRLGQAGSIGEHEEVAYTLMAELAQDEALEPAQVDVVGQGDAAREA